MRILGIDPALSVTGYGVIDVKRGRISLVEAGVIRTLQQAPLTERLNKIYLAVVKLILDTKPDAAVLEKLYAHYRHPTTAYLLGQARGVIILACAKNNLPVEEYAATRIKKAIVGEGLASKFQVQKIVIGLLNLKSAPKFMDVTDALALAIAHSYINKVKI